MADIESGRVRHHDVVARAAPGSAGQFAAGRDLRRLDGFGEDDLLAGVASVPGVQPEVPVLVQVPLVALAVLDGHGEPVDRLEQRQRSPHPGRAGHTGGRFCPLFRDDYGRRGTEAVESPVWQTSADNGAALLASPRIPAREKDRLRVEHERSMRVLEEINKAAGKA
ncbi:hypothetical protein [Streptomyces sp. CJ_13]|uniref:hypothetical protein n=1 Tax=Streptomyces sp. CJ_13 TaxID=2724943 RepID=UPI00202A6EB7|nr:hypothetical protein [Streptomyces sp. CJ_13]